MTTLSIKHLSVKTQAAIRRELSSLTLKQPACTSHAKASLPGIGFITRADLKVNTPHSIFIKNKLAKRLYYLVKHRRGISVPSNYWPCRWSLEEEAYMMDDSYCTQAEEYFIDRGLYADTSDIPYEDLANRVREEFFEPTGGASQRVVQEEAILIKAYDILTVLYDQCYLDKYNFLTKQTVTAYHTLRGDSRVFAYYEIGDYKFHMPLDLNISRKIAPTLITHIDDWRANDTSKLSTTEKQHLDTFITTDILGAPTYACLEVDLDIGWDIKQERESRRFIELE